MSACALRRWGPGTSCVRDSTPAEKEVSLKLAAMQAEREKQDMMWTQNKSKPDVNVYQGSPEKGRVHEPRTRN